MPRKSAAAARSLYSPHPSIEYARAILANLKTKTGRTLEEWIALLEKKGPKEEAARRDWLESEHDLGGTTAWGIAELSVGKGREGIDEEAYLAAAPGYVERMYEGKKAALRPLHDALVAMVRALAPTVRICPCETIVPFYREHVVAQIKPATLARIDFGLALKGVKGRLPARLIDTGGLAKKDRITHCFRIASVAEIDDEVRKWTQAAWDLDG